MMRIPFWAKAVGESVDIDFVDGVHSLRSRSLHNLVLQGQELRAVAVRHRTWGSSRAVPAEADTAPCGPVRKGTEDSSQGAAHRSSPSPRRFPRSRPGSVAGTRASRPRHRHDGAAPYSGRARCAVLHRTPTEDGEAGRPGSVSGPWLLPADSLHATPFPPPARCLRVLHGYYGLVRLLVQLGITLAS